MKRPYVNLKSENKINDFMLELQNSIKKLKSLEGVIGITLNGGMSRGYVDYLSEIDIVIYLDKENYELCDFDQRYVDRF
ncbi:nucleotidyltransferase domain-containing protein, partial [Aminipila sp.]|uniref:nucleotidyltransferase domain-containing protein n=1 Tax=Aminipila sp. TaxID=2060095 RepID=UPI00289C1E57